jgi:hypothetical protein
MKRAILFLVAGIGAPLLSSCSPPLIEIMIRKEGGGTRADLSQDWGVVFSDRKAPCVQSAALYRGGETYGKAVWEVRVEKTVWCRDLRTVVIGQTPRGFDEVTPLPPSSAGEYILVIGGVGIGETPLRLD